MAATSLEPALAVHVGTSAERGDGENAAHQIDRSLMEAEGATIAVEWQVEGFMHCTRQWELLRWWADGDLMKWWVHTGEDDDRRLANLPLMDLDGGFAFVRYYRACYSSDDEDEGGAFIVPHCRHQTVHACKRPFTNIPDEEVDEDLRDERRMFEALRPPRGVYWCARFLPGGILDFEHLPVAVRLRNVRTDDFLIADILR